MVRRLTSVGDADDEDHYAVISGGLCQAFQAWANSEGVGVAADDVEAHVLQYKWRYLGSSLTAWVLADLDELFLGVYPARVIVGDSELDEILTTTASYLEFLDDAWLLDDSSDDIEVLLQRCEQLREPFRAAMHDSIRFTPSKRLWTRARDMGVDPTDERAVQTHIADFNSLSWEERGEILGAEESPSPPDDRGRLRDSSSGDS